MPPPSSENDLKRHARRRLIGAVALSLLAVILLPLLLEDEPPPASPLAVRMAAVPEALPEQPERSDTPNVANATPAPEPETDSRSGPPAESYPKEEPVKAEPAKAEASNPPPKPQLSRPAALSSAQPKPAAASEEFVVQLAALSDSAKADALMGRAVMAGLPAYTDKLGELTRVRVGPYSSREAAETAAKKLADNGLPAGRVVAK